MWKCTHAQLPLICLSASLISHLFNVCLLGGNTVILRQCQNVAHPFLSISPPECTSSRLGKHDITSKQWRNRNKLWAESGWDPLKEPCDTKKKRWRSSAFFYNRQLLLARDPRDNWFCLEALNHFFLSFFPQSCGLMPYYNSAVTPTCCKRMKCVTDGKYYLPSYSLLAQHHSHARICTYSMSEILDWPPAVITTSGTSSHFNLPNTMFPHSSLFVCDSTQSPFIPITIFTPTLAYDYSFIF